MVLFEIQYMIIYSIWTSFYDPHSPNFVYSRRTGEFKAKTWLKMCSIEMDFSPILNGGTMTFAMRYFSACASTRFHFHSIGSDQFWIRAVNVRLKFVELAREMRKVQERNEKKKNKEKTGASNAFLPHKQNANTNISFCARSILFIFVLVSYWSTIAIALPPHCAYAHDASSVNVNVSASARSQNENKQIANQMKSQLKSLSIGLHRIALNCFGTDQIGTERIVSTYIHTLRPIFVFA